MSITLATFLASEGVQMVLGLMNLGAFGMGVANTVMNGINTKKINGMEEDIHAIRRDMITQDALDEATNNIMRQIGVNRMQLSNISKQITYASQGIATYVNENGELAGMRREDVYTSAVNNINNPAMFASFNDRYRQYENGFDRQYGNMYQQQSQQYNHQQYQQYQQSGNAHMQDVYGNNNNDGVTREFMGNLAKAMSEEIKQGMSDSMKDFSNAFNQTFAQTMTDFVKQMGQEDNK